MYRNIWGKPEIDDPIVLLLLSTLHLCWRYKFVIYSSQSEVILCPSSMLSRYHVCLHGLGHFLVGCNAAALQQLHKLHRGRVCVQEKKKLLYDLKQKHHGLLQPLETIVSTQTPSIASPKKTRLAFPQLPATKIIHPKCQNWAQAAAIHQVWGQASTAASKDIREVSSTEIRTAFGHLSI